MDKPLLKDKYALSITEAASYFGVGENKLRELTESSDCPFVLWTGNKRLIKRERFETYLNNTYSI